MNHKLNMDLDVVTSYQSQTNEHSQHNEFLFAKRRIEMERILKTCKTPFYFKGKKKTQYADSIDADDGSQVPAQIMIDLVRKLQPRKTVRPSTVVLCLRLINQTKPL